ncbi:hypothetical protein DFH07DRAFT_947863 [Mycena maculata]|uniref:Uncharacterized protein n=1 Tax=Mycena maculata TaxID=230809 RepID=A0AAD7H772_9AGAR|nr:hypothetical protein DFH07DRAFT_947863 [Mycena maculata]
MDSDHWHTQDSPQGMDPAPGSELSNRAQYPPTHYDGALSSQPPPQGMDPAPGGGQYGSRPLPPPPPPTAQYSYPAPAAPQPHLPMARSTHQYFANYPNHSNYPGSYHAPIAPQFEQHASHSEYSESVYGTPQEHPSPSAYWTPAHTHGDQQMADAEWPGNHTQMPGGYPPTTPTQHDQSGFQPMSADTQNTYPHGAQPTPGPSTIPRPSINPTQQNHHNQPNDQSMETDDEDYQRKVPSRTSIRSGTHDQGTPSIPAHNVIRVAHKFRAVEHPDMEYARTIQQDMFRERRVRRDAETSLRATQQQLKDQQQQQVRLREEMDARVEEANKRAEEAEAARKAQEREAEKRQAEYDASLATLTRRFAVRGPRPRQDPPQEFPDAPPVFQPRFISQTTRESRQLDTITRNVGGDLPHLNLRHVEQGSSRNAAEQNGENDSSDESESENEGVSRKGKSSRKGKGSRLRETLGSDQADLKVLLRELLTEMNVTGVKKSRSRKKVGRITMVDRAKKEQQSNMTKEDDLNCKASPIPLINGKPILNWLQAVVREIFRLSTRLNRAVDFVDYQPATDNQAAQCGNPDGEKPLPGVSPLYFGKGFKTTMWNDMLIRGLIADLQRKRAEDPNHLGIPNVSGDYLVGLFLNCISEARLNWARYQPRPGETVGMARVRAQRFDNASRKKKTSRARKETKWKKRCQTAKKMTLLCAGNADAVQAWKWVKKLLQLLGSLGMSSEDAKPRKFRLDNQIVQQTTHIISICPWRREDITNIVDFVDDAADKISLKKGINARPRLRGEVISNTPAPQGLPETLYDEQWMKEGLDMDSDFQNDLMVSDEAFEIMELVAEDLLGGME